MASYSSVKDEGATTPQSPIMRYLGLIKVMSVIMAILIVTALVVIVVTIHSRLTVMDDADGPRLSEIALPEGARVSAASLGERGDVTLVILYENRQQILHYDRSGRLQQQINIKNFSP